MSTKDEQEQAALRALISASLRISESDVSEEEVQMFLKHAPELPTEYITALNRLDTQLTSADAERSSTPASSRGLSVSGAAMTLYTAMNRKNAEDKHSKETETELERKRKEILDKLKNQGGR